MCIGRAWEVSRVRSGIVGMESNQSSHRILWGLPMVPDMLNHRRQIGLQVGEKLGDLVQAPFDGVKARRCRFATARDWLAWCRQPVALEHRVKVLRLPAECYRQRFQGARATTALHLAMLNFTH